MNITTIDQLPPVAKLLAQARALILDGGWTQKAWARDEKGTNMGPTDPRASCWCAVGALTRARYPNFTVKPAPVGEYHTFVQANNMLHNVSHDMGYDSPASLNDEPLANDSSLVMLMYDRAIHVAMERGL